MFSVVKANLIIGYTIYLFNLVQWYLLPFLQRPFISHSQLNFESPSCSNPAVASLI